MRSCSKRNKSKAWVKTYGKVFLRKRSIMIMQAAVNASVASANIGAISASFGGQSGKAAAIAEVVISSTKEIGKTIAISNDGFATKGR